MKSKKKKNMEDMVVWKQGFEAIKKLNFCGCGRPDEAYAALLETLKAHDKEGDRRKWSESRGGNWNGNGSGYDYLVLYFMDAAGLMEHGGNVGGGWPNEAGKAVIKFLEDWGTEPDEWPEETDFEKTP